MTIHRARHRYGVRALTVLSALALTAAAACGDDDDDTATGGDGDGGGGEASLAQFETNADAFDALEVGRVDAVALTTFTILDQTDQMDGFEATEGFIPEIDGEEQLGCGGFGFRYEDVDLRNAFNEELAAMQEAGEVLPIVEPFGFDEPAVEAAKDVTANDLAEGAYDDISEEVGDISQWQESGVVIGTGQEPPYGFEEDGEVTGEAPELAKEIFSRLDIEIVDHTSTEFAALIDSLNAGRMDVISAGMFINAERAENVLFANPDYCASTAFAVPEGNPDDLSDLQSVVDAGITLGVVNGTVELDYMNQILGE
jgi:ABC-type amino acid transport substrate-binding protein